MSRSFEDILVVAEQLAAGQNRLQDTILKELLHSEMLLGMSQSGLAKSLVFQGGTALRLCYRNPRYSEDLDFVRNGPPLDQDAFDKFKQVLTQSFADKYGLQVRIADPKHPLGERTTSHSVALHRWVATVAIDSPRVKNQKIHIEVADVPAYDARPRMINSPYPQYQSGQALLHVSSEEEILADKLVALAGRDYIKARDVWDIKWLRDRGLELNLDWVLRKAADYHLIERLNNTAPLVGRLRARVEQLATEAIRKQFADEMSRFLAREQAAQWLNDPAMTAALLRDVGDFVQRQAARLAKTAA